MSDFSSVCDAILADLTENVSVLTEAVTHRYAPWDPQTLDVADDKRHVAVWPAGEATEEATPETAGGLGGSHLFTQGYVVLVWEREGSEEEASRRKMDEPAAETFLNLHNEIRARFYVSANQTLGGAHPLWYVGTDFPDFPGRVRWMRLALRGRRYQDFTP